MISGPTSDPATHFVMLGSASNALSNAEVLDGKSSPTAAKELNGMASPSLKIFRPPLALVPVRGAKEPLTILNLSIDIICCITDELHDDATDAHITCFALACRHFYPVLKYYVKTPIKLSDVSRPEIITGDFYANFPDKWIYEPAVLLGDVLKDFMGQRYREADRSKHRYLRDYPMYLSREVYGEKHGFKEDRLERMYSDYTYTKTKYKMDNTELLHPELMFPRPFGMGAQWFIQVKEILKALEAKASGLQDRGSFKYTMRRARSSYAWEDMKIEEMLDTFEDWIMMMGL